MCDLVPPDDVASNVGAPVEAVPEATTDSICTYRVADTETYDLAVRIEDAFADLAGVRSMVPDGTELAITDRATAYWVPAIYVLWLDTGTQLYAIQLIGFPEGEHRALDIATTLAELLATRI